MKRYLSPYFSEYIARKILLLSGPRQVGKTTFVKTLSESLAYYNYDIKDDVQVFLKREWDRKKKIVVFDELHKMKNWKLWLKGIYDKDGVDKQHIVVTGSARLDIAKKMGDSLAGRFFAYRMYPFDLKELKNKQSLQKNYETLMAVGGFPEPFTEGSQKFYGMWKRSHLDLILRQDLLSLEMIRDIDSLEMLISLLSYQVGSTVSYHSLAQELQKDEKTVKKWMGHLENLFLIFKVPPFSTKFPRSVKKACKYYFYDIAKVRGKDAMQTEAAKLENLVALSLKKECDFLNDCFGENFDVQFVKLLDQREVDFLILKDQNPYKLFEVKLGAQEISSSLRAIGNHFNQIEKIQLVKNLKKEYSSADGIQVLSLLPYLENLQLDS